MEGNEIAYLLARQGADKHASWNEKTSFTISYYYGKVKDWVSRENTKRWKKNFNRFLGGNFLFEFLSVIVHNLLTIDVNNLK